MHEQALTKCQKASKHSKTWRKCVTEESNFVPPPPPPKTQSDALAPLGPLQSPYNTQRRHKEQALSNRYNPVRVRQGANCAPHRLASCMPSCHISCGGRTPLSKKSGNRSGSWFHTSAAALAASHIVVPLSIKET